MAMGMQNHCHVKCAGGSGKTVTGMDVTIWMRPYCYRECQALSKKFKYFYFVLGCYYIFLRNLFLTVIYSFCVFWVLRNFYVYAYTCNIYCLFILQR